MGVKKYDLKGVQVYDLNLLPDERGFFFEAFRKDWQELLEGDEMVQTNVSFSYPGMIRAWHQHVRGQVDYFLVLEGALRICAYDDGDESPTKGKLVEITASEQKRQLVRIPGTYWHGFKNIGDKPALLVYFTNRMYDYDNPDEGRRPWNDPTITDPGTGKPYDWNRPRYM